MHAIKGILDKGMKKIVTIFALLGTLLSAEAQNTLSLDSCRAMALRNNKQINVSRLKKDVAYNLGKQVYIQSLGMNHCIRAEILHQLFANVINLLSAEYGNTRPFSVNVESYHI